MSEITIKPSPQEAAQIWSMLAGEGKAPSELDLARHVLPSFSAGVEPWINRIVKTYLRGLCLRYPHFKLVLAPYGGGKTHFLMSLGVRALDENFAVSCIACTKGVSLDSPLDLYKAFIKALWFPRTNRPGPKSLLEAAVLRKQEEILAAGAPDPAVAFEHWVRTVERDDHPENAFGRVMAEALRATADPSRLTCGDAAIRWLQGDINTLDRKEQTELRLARVPARAQGELGRNLLLSMVRFSREAGAHGTVILFDEVETLLTTGKALRRVLVAMRHMLDIPNSIAGGLPLLGIFSVTEIEAALEGYPALGQRLSTRGVPFRDGNDYAPQLPLEQLVPEGATLLTEIGNKLVMLGEKATNHRFDRGLQHKNIDALAHEATRYDLEISRIRIFVKAAVSILDQQVQAGEREYFPEELRNRYRGSFDELRIREQDEEDP